MTNAKRKVQKRIKPAGDKADFQRRKRLQTEILATIHSSSAGDRVPFSAGDRLPREKVYQRERH